MQIQMVVSENLFEDLSQTLAPTKLGQSPLILKRVQLLEQLQIRSEKNIEKKIK